MCERLKAPSIWMCIVQTMKLEHCNAPYESVGDAFVGVYKCNCQRDSCIEQSVLWVSELAGGKCRLVC